MAFYGIHEEPKMIEDALEAGDIAWWVMELPSGVVFFSPNKTSMLGYTSEQATQFVHYTSFTDLLHPDDYESVMKAMKDHLSGNKPVYETEYRIRSADGGYVRMFDRGRIVAKNGDETTVAGVVLKITSSPE